MIDPVIDPLYLLLEGVSESCSDEMVRLYLTLIVNPGLEDAIKIESLRRNRFRVLVKLSQKVSFEDITQRQNKLPNLAGKAVIISQVRTPNMIRVSNLANSCTKELLSLYFSNTKISSGGDIKSIKMIEYENKALIQFKDFSKVDAVMEESHSICETTVKVEKYYGAIEDEYFNEEEEIELQTDQSSMSKLNLVNKQHKSASNNFFTIKSFSQLALAIDKTKLIISNINENINIQQLDFYIQLITVSYKCDINDIHWSLEKKGKLLIDFKKEIDMAKVLNEFNNSGLNNLNGKPIQLETVNKTKTLVVLILDHKGVSRTRQHMKGLDWEEYTPELIPATKDLINLYFMNKQRSGGGDIESIERKSSKYWLVNVKDFRIMKDILARKHVVDEKPLRMLPYYENFGLPYLFKPLQDEFSEKKNESKIFKLKLRDERLRFFSKVKTLHKKLNDILAEVNAVCRFNKQETNILYVNYVEQVATRVPYTERIWQIKVKESIEYFLQIYKYEKLTLSTNQWTTITKSKLLNEEFFEAYQSSGKGDDLVDTESIGGVSTFAASDIKYIGNNCAIVSIIETGTNVEISIVGDNNEVNRFIVKIKDTICQAYFTFELEEKIIKFKTYLFECEELLTKWLVTFYLISTFLKNFCLIDNFYYLKGFMTGLKQVRVITIL